MQLDPAMHRLLGKAPRRRKGLVEALHALAEEKAELLRHSEQAWASITFSGARHTLALAFTGAEAVAAGERFLAALPDHEFTLPRQLVADAAVVRVDHATLPDERLEVEIEVLVLDEE